MNIVYQTANASVPVKSSAATALAANANRLGWGIQNCGTNPLFVLMGSGATSAVFHTVLSGGGIASDGSGATFVQTAGVIYTGIVTTSGVMPLYTTFELAP